MASGISSAGSQILVSIHDVAPSTLAEVRWLSSALDGIGARPLTLMVVPAEPAGEQEAGSGALDEDLAAFLRGEMAKGTGIVLHGYSHRRRGRFRGAWPDRLRGRLFAREAAEFLALEPAAIRQRLKLGRAAFSSLGPLPAGFCAPGWLGTPDLEACLAEQNFRFLVGFVSILDLARRRRIFAPSGGYMGVPRDEPLVRLESALACGLARGRPFQLFLHPQHASTSRSCSRVLGLAERLLRVRQPVTYEALLDGIA